MIQTFAYETGVEVKDLYWVGNIGQHVKSLTDTIFECFKKSRTQISDQFEAKVSSSPRTEYDVLDVSIMKEMWGQTAWINSFYQGINTPEMNQHLNVISKMPGVNEILQSKALNLDEVHVTVSAGDWKGMMEDNVSNVDTTPGSVWVCLQAPHGCMLQSGDSKLKVRRGDVIILNEAIRHAVMPTKPVYMPRNSANEQVEWINQHGMVFMKLDRVKQAA